jgi:divalent metal cation (Fe/Co/Zn/Cd) transporter
MRAPLLPPASEALLRRAIRLEIATIAWLASIVVVMTLAMGGSQAMRTAWVEDVLSLVPPVLFLIAVRQERKPPDRRFPYGRLGWSTIAFLCASVALVAIGLFLLVTALIELLGGHRPSLGGVELFGGVVWSGWPMLAAVLYSAVPPFVLARRKLPIAHALGDKTLAADADMGKADWLTAVATAGGVGGIGFGLWWADSVAAAAISLDVMFDGVRNLRRAFHQVLDHGPVTIEGRPIMIPLQSLRTLPWVRAVHGRFREVGRYIAGEVWIEAEAGIATGVRARQIRELVMAEHERIADVVVSFDAPPATLVDALQSAPDPRSATGEPANRDVVRGTAFARTNPSTNQEQ